MSWSTRFIEKKSEDGWQTVGGNRIPSIDGGRDVHNVRGQGQASGGGGGWASGRSYGGPKKVSQIDPKVDLGSESDFPTLGSKKVSAAAVAAPKPSGFAALASAWAEKEADENAAAAAAAATRRLAYEEQAKAAARTENQILSHALRHRVQMATVTMRYDEDEEVGDDLDSDAYGRTRRDAPRSPPYDPNPDSEAEKEEDDWSMKE